MSSMALSPAAVSRPAVNHWIVAVVVVVPTFMEILDTTIANVALRYIAGGLSAAQTDADWVITSYLAANAIVLPITGWLSAHLGRRNYFLLSIAVFTLASATVRLRHQPVADDPVPGDPGAGRRRAPAVQPGSPAGRLPAREAGHGHDAVRGRRHHRAHRRADAGRLALRQLQLALDLPRQRPDRPVSRWSPRTPWSRTPTTSSGSGPSCSRRPLNFDYIGLGLLVLVMSCWEIMLSKGQEWDWLGDPFGRVQTLLILFVLGLGLLIFREMRIASPIIDFRVLGERNFAVCCVIMFCAFAVVYCASIALPGMLQTLFGYDALRSGLVMSPSGVSSLAAMVVVGVLLGRQVDARWLIAAGLVVMAAGNYWMARMNLQISPWQVVGPRMVLTLGLGLLFAPISVAAYKYIPVHLRGAAVGLLSLLRTEGGSVGTSMAQTIQERREQFHLSRLSERLSPLNPHVQAFLEQTRESSCSGPATRPGRSSWASSRSTSCASSRPRRWPTSTSSGCAPSCRRHSSFWSC